MQKAINRFWDWLFHPSIRWYRYPKGKSAWFRYPSPGSTIEKQSVVDYRSPYESSHLNIRYTQPLKSVTQIPDSYYVGDGPGLTMVQKLTQYGLLEPGENSEQQIEKAKQRFKQKFGVSAETRVYRDDNNIASSLPQGTNRESYRKFIESTMSYQRERKQGTQRESSNRRFIQEPQRVWLQSLDMFSHPHFQQSRLEVDYKLDRYANENAERGYIEIRKGEKTFWKALDDSNDIKNVEKVQKAIGDDRPTDFTLRDTKIEFVKDGNGNVVDVKPNTKGL